jgi:hypothetical protein
VKDLLIYLSGPISRGDLCRNIAQADAAFFAQQGEGVPCIVPQWSCFADSVFRSGESVCGEARANPAGIGHAGWLSADLVIVRRCSAVLRLPGDSVGADAETAEAALHGIPVFHTVAEVLAWAGKEQGDG